MSSLYEAHWPQLGYRKVWPESIWCPICGINNIMRPKAQKAFYVPRRGISGGERACIYVCNTCNQRYKSLSLLTIEEFKEWHKCHLEFVAHLNTSKSIVR